MAAPRREQDSHSREETDLSSPNFDPLTALYSSDVSIPCPDVQLFNNLAEYESVMKKRNARQATLTNVQSTSSATSGTPTAAGDAGCNYGQGPLNISRNIPTQPCGSSGTKSFDYMRQGTGSKSSGVGHMSTTADDHESHEEHPTRDSYQLHKNIHSALQHQQHSERPDEDIEMEYSDIDRQSCDSQQKYPDQQPHREMNLHRQYSPSDRYSFSSASLRDPEYLARKGLHEEDYEHYKISRRDSKSTSHVQTKSESETRGTESKSTKVSRSVGGARGAWSYDTVEKPIEKKVSTETVRKSNDSALPKSFEIERTQTQTGDYRDENRNVFTRMEEYSNPKTGPIHILYRCMKEKLQARVWTRSAVAVRGICKGYIVAFDKHANLAMVDVDEYYRNPTMKGVRLKSKKKLAEKASAGYTDPPLPCEAVWLGLRREKLSQRHMNQIFIRGDNVVSVSIVQDWT